MARTKASYQPAEAPVRATPRLPVTELRHVLLRHLRALCRAATLHHGRAPAQVVPEAWSQAIRYYKNMLSGLRVRLQSCGRAAVERLAVEVRLVTDVSASIHARYALLI